MPSLSLTRVVLSGVVVAALVLLPGCGSGQPGGAAGPNAEGVGTAGGASGSLGEAPDTPGVPEAPAPTSAPPPAPPPASFPTTARAYAEATVAAWSTGDMARLGELTTPGAYEQFTDDVPGDLKTDWIHYRCDGVAGSNYCTLRNGDGDSLRLRITNQRLGAADAVAELSANLTTFPANGEAYVSEFVRAWAGANTPRMRALARPDVVVAVNDNHQDRPTGTWALSTVGEHGGAGLLIVEVDINEGAVHFTLHVGTTLLGGGRAIIGYSP
jgi:hypothetical protein